MWQRFTGKAREVIFAAQVEAIRLNHLTVNTEHLLFALISDEENVACRILKRMDIAPQTVRAALEPQMSKGTADPANKKLDMQLSPQSKSLIDHAYDEARQLSNNYIGTEHLLLGLIRDKVGLAGRVLKQQGVELERTRREVLALQDNDSGQSATAPLPGSAQTGTPTPNAPPLSDTAALARSFRLTAGGATVTAAEMLFNKEFRKLSPEQQQILQTEGLPLSQLPPTFHIIMKVAIEAWDTQKAVILAPDSRLRVQQSAHADKLSYTIQTDVTLFSTLLATDQ